MITLSIASPSPSATSSLRVPSDDRATLSVGAEPILKFFFNCARSSTPRFGHRVERIRAALPQPADHLARAKSALIRRDHDLLQFVEDQLTHVADRGPGCRRVRVMHWRMYLLAHGPTSLNQKPGCSERVETPVPPAREHYSKQVSRVHLRESVSYMPLPCLGRGRGHCGRRERVDSGALSFQAPGLEFHEIYDAISRLLKKNAISLAAVSGASEPCIAFFSMSVAEFFANRARRRLGRIGRAHQLAPSRDRALGPQHHHHHRPRRHVLAERADRMAAPCALRKTPRPARVPDVSAALREPSARRLRSV